MSCFWVYCIAEEREPSGKLSALTWGRDREQGRSCALLIEPEQPEVSKDKCMSVELAVQALPDPLHHLPSGSRGLWVELGLTRAREGFCSYLGITVLTFKR